MLPADIGGKLLAYSSLPEAAVPNWRDGSELQVNTAPSPIQGLSPDIIKTLKFGRDK